MNEEKNIPKEETTDSSPQSTDENSQPSEQGVEPVTAADPQTTNLPTGQAGPKLQTQQMEVHHHGHVHEKKKWKEYVFQFFMLFLAVFCGFLAEYQLEHKIEKDRERQFIRSLYNDIISDTSNLARIIKARTRKELMVDSISYMMNGDAPEKYTREIYPYAVVITRTRPYRFIATDGTMQQLKNAGGLRLIKNQTVVDSIMRYDVNVRNLIGQGGVEERILEDYRTASTKIFDATAYNEMLDEEMNLVRKPSSSPVLLPYTKKELSEWNYRLFAMRGINRGNMRDAKWLLRQGSNLLKTLNKEYHLE